MGTCLGFTHLVRGFFHAAMGDRCRTLLLKREVEAGRESGCPFRGSRGAGGWLGFRFASPGSLGDWWTLVALYSMFGIRSGDLGSVLLVAFPFLMGVQVLLRTYFFEALGETLGLPELRPGEEGLAPELLSPDSGSPD
jgi:hypothetical protein